MAKTRTISKFRAEKPYPTPDAFWKLVDRSGECWLWRGSLKANGYARSASKGITSFAIHRRAYELLVGPVPAGHELDHLCRNRACANPAHLEPVTHQENMRRGEPANRMQCPKGHPYDEQNTYKSDLTGRICKTCRDAASRRSYEA